MSLPRFLKRRTHKSLPKLDKAASEAAPPVPTVAASDGVSSVQATHDPKSSALTALTGPVHTISTLVVPAPGTPANGSFMSSRSSAVSDRHLPTQPVIMPEPITMPQPVTMPVLLSMPLSLPQLPVKAPGQDDEITKQIAEASLQVKNQRQTSKLEKALNAIDDNVTAVQGKQTIAQTYFVAPIKTIMATSGATQAIESGVNMFLEGMPMLMKVLDEVKEIHPFIAVAVLAFKAVYTLETKRRTNDSKILALYVEMKDMIAVLVQLKGIRDEDQTGPDGITIKGRMQELVIKTANDIKDCANTCDTYSKMRLLAKVLKGPVWEDTLAKFVTQFTQRRSDFEFALSMHIGQGVDTAIRKVDNLAEEMKQRMDMILTFFRTHVPPEQKELMVMIQQKGGSESVLEDDKVLKQLNALEKRTSIVQGIQPVAVTGNQEETSFETLKAELRSDPDAAVKVNLVIFERKFAMQQRQIVAEVERVVTRESDRVIESVLSGPHDRLLDKDIHKIWKEMGWRGSVKARHFVLALRDYYNEQEEERRTKELHFEAALADNCDGWALEMITVNRLQQVIEAFDDDASGFITVSEVNRFTTARPLDWSLPHWMAYWIWGWQDACTHYAQKIDELFQKMFALRGLVHPANRGAVELYLLLVWLRVSQLTASLERFTLNDTLKARFRSYIDAEEERLRLNLEAIRYDIDDMETLSLVIGPGRPEKYLFPLLYLMMKKDFEMLRLARTHILSPDELWDAGNNFHWIFEAATIRMQSLLALFKQQGLDPDKQFQYFACKVYNIRYETKEYFSRTNMRKLVLPEYKYDDAAEAQNIKPEDILNYPVESDHPYDCAVYEAWERVETEQDKQAQGPIKAILGTWYGFSGWSDIYPYQSMFAIDFHVSASNNEKVEAAGYNGTSTAFTMVGEYETADDGQVTYVFTRKFVTRYRKDCFRGTLSEDGITLTGTWDGASNPPGFFILSKRSPFILCCRPPPRELMSNKTRALWKFALTAVHDDVCRRMFTWSFLKRRRDIRKRYLELLTRKFSYGYPLNKEEDKEFFNLRQSMTFADVRFYYSIQQYRLRTAVIHVERVCDACDGNIGGTRATCLDCDTGEILDVVDLCDDDRCLSAKISFEDRDQDLPNPHLPSHRLLKLRITLQMWEWGKMDSDARDAMRRAEAAFNDAAEIDGEETDGPVGNVEDPTAKMLRDRLACVACGERVTRLGWICVLCTDEDVFICEDCDGKNGVTAGKHASWHAVVSCREQVCTVALSTDQRLQQLEDQFGTMGNKLGTMDDKLLGVDVRLLRMEKILDTLSSRLRDSSTVHNVL